MKVAVYELFCYYKSMKNLIYKNSHYTIFLCLTFITQFSFAQDIIFENGFENSPPEISSVTLTPLSANETSVLTCNASATDPESDLFVFDYEWFINNASQNGLTSSFITGTHFNRDDDVYCVVIAADAFNDSQEVSSNTVSIDNSQPTVTFVSITPTTAFTTTTMVCNTSGMDADGDSVTFSYQWKVNGNVVSTTNTLSSNNFVKGDNVDCTVTAYDGFDNSNPVVSASIPILNSPPSISSASIQQFFTPDSLSCSPIGVQDLDSDSLTFSYVWKLNGNIINNENSSSLQGTHYSGGDTVICEIIAIDGTVNSNTAISQIQI